MPCTNETLIAHRTSRTNRDYLSILCGVLLLVYLC